jgi:quercetin dioxygenase-like cupin family protein
MRSVAQSLCALWLLVPLTQAGAAMKAPATFAELQGEVLLDNDHVFVEKFVIQPGHSTGPQSHPADQLRVFTKGGVLTTSGRSIVWKEGRVDWQSASARVDPASVNSSSQPIELVCVTLKGPANAPPIPTIGHLNYPNIPGEDLLENDRVIVQRFNVKPGQWEGVHGHPPNMLYIHIKGGQWAARSKHEPEHSYPARSEDGKIGWMTPVDFSEGHESGNVGKEPIDLIWVQLRQ